MNFFRTSRRTALLSVVVATAAAMALPAQAQQIKPGGTLVVAQPTPARQVNTAVQAGTMTTMIGSQIFASPLRFDDKWEPQPYLAEKWTLAPDAKSLTLNLRKDAVFHDGKPITSADVAFSIMAIKANHPFSTMLEPVEKVETPDAHTAIIRMSRAHPAIILAMSPGLCPIMPKHIYGDGQDLKTHPRNTTNVVGSGPFRLTEFDPTRRIVLERFDKYFLPGKPYLDKVIFNVNPNMESLVLALQKGDIQMLPFVSAPNDLKRLSEDKNLSVVEKGYEGFGAMTWLAFNLDRKPVSDLAVRQAIAAVVDRNFINKVLMGGFGTPAQGPIVPGSPYALTGNPIPAADVKKANSLLDDAGYKVGANGERFELTIDYIPGANLHKTLAEYIRSQLKKIGIKVNVRASSDSTAWAQRIGAHDFDMTMDVVFNWSDPVIGVHRTFLSTNIKPVVWTNTQSYRNPKVDELLNAAAIETDPVKRKAYYATFQKIVNDDLPVYAISRIPYHTAISKKIGNVPMTIWGPASPYDEVYFK